MSAQKIADLIRRGRCQPASNNGARAEERNPRELERRIQGLAAMADILAAEAKDLADVVGSGYAADPRNQSDRVGEPRPTWSFFWQPTQGSSYEAALSWAQAYGLYR